METKQSAPETVTGAGERPMESRVGRSNQRYNAEGKRLVAGVVPVSEDRQRVLLIQSTRRKGWVLPKGGWETDELVMDAAKREAWEEAGIEVRIELDLGQVEDKRKAKAEHNQCATIEDSCRSLMHFFEAVVLQEHKVWPEAHKRERQWMSYEKAMDELKDRPELQHALKSSSLKKSTR